MGTLERFARWLIWTALLFIFCGVLIPLVFGHQPTLESRFRWAGLGLQLAGLCSVVVGLLESRTIFGKPSLREMIAMFFGAEKPKRGVSLSGEMVALFLSDADVRVKVGTTDINKRLDQLEQDVNALWERSQKAEANLKGLEDRTVARLDELRRDREEEELNLRAKLEAAAIGGIHLEFYGVGFLLFGIVFATIPTELGSGVEFFLGC